MTAITDIIGREILDSRGNPTVEVDVLLEEEARSAEQGELDRLAERLQAIDEAFAGFVEAAERELGARARA